jgi:hypothetical protein
MQGQHLDHGKAKVEMLHIEGNTATAKRNWTVVDDGERRANRQRIINRPNDNDVVDRCIRAEESSDRRVRREDPARDEAKLPPEQIVYRRLRPAHRVGRPEVHTESHFRLLLEGCVGSSGHQDGSASL